MRTHVQRKQKPAFRSPGWCIWVQRTRRRHPRGIPRALALGCGHHFFLKQWGKFCGRASMLGPPRAQAGAREWKGKGRSGLSLREASWCDEERMGEGCLGRWAFRRCGRCVISKWEANGMLREQDGLRVIFYVIIMLVFRCNDFDG